MKGKNKIILNKETMIEALAEYFGKRMKPIVCVTDLEPDRSGTGHQRDYYTVSLEEVEPLSEAPIDDGT
jgi:hypothetical protein